MRILVVDNYDSFTYNLCHLIAGITGSMPLVRKNDEITMADVESFAPHAIVLSPGPGHPSFSKDFGICPAILDLSTCPVLGVCLGHQGIALQWGAAVVPLAAVQHGITTPIFHNESPLFRGIPQGFLAVRYHSFTVDPQLSLDIEVLAWAADQSIMAIRHRSRPLFGVQFHPESICTDHGAQLMRNFLSLCTSITHRQLDFYVEPEHAYRTLFAEDTCSFWLDSSRVQPGLSRFSFVGGSSIPGSYPVEYAVANQQLTLGPKTHASGARTQTLFDYLKEALIAMADAPPAVQCGFHGGFVGYFGYELKKDCGYPNVHTSPLPDAALLYVPAVLAFDHEKHTLHIFTAQDDPETKRWVENIETRLREHSPALLPEASATNRGAYKLRDSKQNYLDGIESCQKEIRAGETYEACLTTQLLGAPIEDSLSFYLHLRQRNPAPYAAFLKFGTTAVACSSPERFLRIDPSGHVTSKPIKGTAPRSADANEDARLLQALSTSQKDLSEHLMVLDLVRNDLGRVCEPGSVDVPQRMQIESYATVHQLVSTVSGQLQSECTAVDCMQACFPGGSMTGAPKRRTLEILDRLESGPRGIYSGAIGYLGIDGAADLNIVIRSVVMTPESTTIGAGGGIVALSDPESEYKEVLLKLAAVTG
jgi:para-aminobenzoate synthetase